MFYIVGTAGHIDHGKTSLVKALTGEDTNRLKEEKERGISIELGFAHLDLPDGTRAGVVDVPGHERFIRHMLAGAHGIDLVLFTVAADDGVMPQTEEHFDILHLLGTGRAIFVITKADIASEARIKEVEEEIQILTAGTPLADSTIIPFSSVTGRGLDQLRAEIARTLQAWEKPRAAGPFRLPVDRVFVLQGHGLIVTGTALSGEVSVGDRVRSLPGNQLFRVRSIQVHNQPVATAVWGQRVALNLTGHEKPSIERGQVICHESITTTSERFDAFLEVRPAAADGIKSHQRVRVHVGTAEVLAKVIVLESGHTLGPRQSGYCQVALSEPVLALRGDHFVVRDETAQRTLGGGVVVHPWARKHKKIDADLRRSLERLHRGALRDVVEAFLDETDELAVSIAPLSQFVNLAEDEVERQLARMETIRLFEFEGEKLFGLERAGRRVQEELERALRDFHAAHPLLPGMELETLRDRLSYQVPPRLFRAVVERLEAAKVVVREGNILHLPEHSIELADEDRTLVERITSLLGSSPYAPPDLKQIEKETGVDRARLGEIIRLMEREGSIVRVAVDLYFLSSSVDTLRAALRRHLSEHGEITTGAFRDLYGTSRKYSIPLLEYFDREGVTLRVGDARRLRHRPDPIERDVS